MNFIPEVEMFRLHFLVFLVSVYTSILAVPLLTYPSLGLLNGEVSNLVVPIDVTLRNQSR